MQGSPQRHEAAAVLQAELIVGDQSGAIHIWDLKTDHNEQLIPEPEVSVNSVHIDPDASYMAAVNSSVSPDGIQCVCGGDLWCSGACASIACSVAEVGHGKSRLLWGGRPSPPVSPQGNCYVWNLTGGIGEEVTQLIPKTEIPAHNRYALQCKFSPDST